MSAAAAARRDLRALAAVANRLRIHCVESTNAAKSGHPTSCASCAELIAALFFDPAGMHYLPADPKNLHNDRFVLSKGHAAPILYAAWAEAGLVPVDDLKKLRTIGSDLEGHPTPRLSFVDVATGSLGQGLGAACGMAYGAKKLLQLAGPRYYALLGDGEVAEGSVWEALSFAGVAKLDNVCAILDLNVLGQSGPTAFADNWTVYNQRFEAFGWKTICIDGHNLEEVVGALEAARNTRGVPTAIIARTVKGKGLGADIEGQQGWHGKPLGDKAPAVIAELRRRLGAYANVKLTPTPPDDPSELHAQPFPAYRLPPADYEVGSEVATRMAYGHALKALGEVTRRAGGPPVVAVDGDVKNSTGAEEFEKEFKGWLVEAYIAEQNLVSLGIGLQVMGALPFCATFGAFFTRAFDQLRMAGISKANLKLVGSHCGVSIGEDGPSQMALEDLGMFRALPGAVVLYPSDGVSSFGAVQLAAAHPGLVYIRTSRPKFKVLYDPAEQFSIGLSKLVRHTPNDHIAVVGAGVTLHEALLAHEILRGEGIHIRVIDLFSVQPIDRHTLLLSGQACSGLVLTVEDHYRSGGIYEAVSAELADDPSVRVFGLYVRQVPHSGTEAELLDRFGISARAIAERCRELFVDFVPYHKKHPHSMELDAAEASLTKEVLRHTSSGELSQPSATLSATATLGPDEPARLVTG